MRHNTVRTGMIRLHARDLENSLLWIVREKYTPPRTETDF